MLEIDEINKIVWLKDTEEITIFLVIESNSFKQVFCSNKNNQTKSIVFKDSEILINGNKITENIENECQNFFSRIDRMLRKKSFFSVIINNEKKNWRFNFSDD